MLQISTSCLRPSKVSAWEVRFAVTQMYNKTAAIMSVHLFFFYYFPPALVLLCLLYPAFATFSWNRPGQTTPEPKPGSGECAHKRSGALRSSLQPACTYFSAQHVSWSRVPASAVWCCRRLTSWGHNWTRAWTSWSRFTKKRSRVWARLKVNSQGTTSKI